MKLTQTQSINQEMIEHVERALSSASGLDLQFKGFRLYFADDDDIQVVTGGFNEGFVPADDQDEEDLGAEGDQDGD